MRDSDFHQFAELLDGCYALLGREKALNGPAKALFFRALGVHSIEAVRAGFDAHVKDPQRGRFAPTPADVIAQIEGLVADDGRPGAEEAWAMCSNADDESETVVWSSEMSQAYSVASSLMQAGDHIGARMAFKEAYSRLVDSARRERKPVEWSVSLGHDVNKRQAALLSAETRGLLPSGEALRLAPPAADMHTTATLLIENASQSADVQTVKERVAALKALLVRPEVESFEAERRREFDERKRLADEAVKAYTQMQEAQQ